MGGPTADYYVALARLHMMKEEYDSAETDLKQATQIDHQVLYNWKNEMVHVHLLLYD